MESAFCCYLVIADGPWRIRIDKQQGDGRCHQRHIHVTREGQKGECSWNVDGTRHDKRRFPTAEKQIHKARELASEHLGVPVDKLQFILEKKGGNFFTILSLNESPNRGRRVFSAYIRVRESLIVLGTDAGGMAIVILKS
jgi:hypothetical protein